MCIQGVVRYSYYFLLHKHAVDRTEDYTKALHEVQTSKVLVGDSIPQHSPSALRRHLPARRRRTPRALCQLQSGRVKEVSNNGQAVGSDRNGSHGVLLQYPPQVEIVDPDQAAVGVSHSGNLDLSQSDVQSPSTSTASPQHIDTTNAPPGNVCPDYEMQSVASYPRECDWTVEQTIERGDTATDINRRRLHHLLSDSLVFDFANLSRRIAHMAVTQSSDPCMGTNSHTTTNSTQLETPQSCGNTGASTSQAAQLPTANPDRLQESESPFTATSHTRKRQKRTCIPPCYLLIFLGFLTVIGSLLPGLWRASSSNDLSGGFSLAQYILGVGIFVVGSMVAIHSKSCECWKTHKRASVVVGGGH